MADFQRQLTFKTSNVRPRVRSGVRPGVRPDVRTVVGSARVVSGAEKNHLIEAASFGHLDQM